VFELSKKVGVPSKDLVHELQKMGAKGIKNHMSTLEDKHVETITNKYLKKPSQAAAPPKAEKRTKVLIKRKPSPVEAPVVVSQDMPSVKPQQEPEIVHTAPPKGQPRPAHTAVPVLGEGEAPVLPVVESVPAPVSASPAPVSAAEPEKKEDKKNLLKTDLFELAKKEVSDRFRERFKKGRKTPRGREEKLVDYRYQGVQWQGLKLPRRKEDRPHKAAESGVAVEITKPRKKVIKLSPGLTVKEFAEQIGQKAGDVIKKLMEMGAMATMNQPMDLTAAVMIAENYGLKVEAASELTEEELLQEGTEPGLPEQLVPRPPVVTIMGHVDHGKTSLLDAIRKTKVTDTEAGGITQHIGAYCVKVGERQVVFQDTPGHEAFTAMRARGAKVTDIVVLVVAADDGVMPQTIEAIDHAKAAGVPIIVAINKIDKPETNPEKVKNSLSEHGLISEAWGGQNIFVEVSAKKRIGLDALLEMILLQADVLELKANPNKPAKGVIIEAKMDKGRGPVATVLIQEGTLKAGDAFVTGVFSGKVRGLINDQGMKVDHAGPSMPVEVIGLPGVPQAGDTFVVVKEEWLARDIAMSRMQRQRVAELAQYKRVTLDDLYNQIKAGTVKELGIIIKADVQGSVGAVTESLEKLSTAAVKLRVIHGGVGGITETDVLLASASNAIIIGCNVRPEPKAQALAERESVDVRLYTIIYNAIADVKAAMEGLLEPTLKERVLGRAEVRQLFQTPKVGMIAGAYVTDGIVSRNSAGVRVLRDQQVVYQGKINSLRRFKDDVREVQTGYECGIGVENFNDLKTGDVLEVYTIDKIAAKLA
jgi:translation initiation factor IF-2